jgi:hypothetical protein
LGIVKICLKSHFWTTFESFWANFFSGSHAFCSEMIPAKPILGKCLSFL